MQLGAGRLPYVLPGAYTALRRRVPSVSAMSSSSAVDLSSAAVDLTLPYPEPEVHDKSWALWLRERNQQEETLWLSTRRAGQRKVVILGATFVAVYQIYFVAWVLAQKPCSRCQARYHVAFPAGLFAMCVAVLLIMRFSKPSFQQVEGMTIVAMLVALACSGWMSRGPQLEKANTIWPVDDTGAGVTPIFFEIK